MSDQAARGTIELTVTEMSGWTDVAVEGELDVTTSSTLKELIDAAPGARGVILELEAVSFIDSTALGVLISAQRRLRREGRELRVVVSNPIVVRIITISGVDELFELHPSVSAALAAT